MTATKHNGGSRLPHLLLLLFGVMCASSAVIIVKASHEHPILLASYRLLVAVVFLLPLFLRDCRRYRSSYGLPHLAASILPGFLLGLHFMSWIAAARMTAAVNASLLVNLSPVAMPFFLLVLVHERVNRQEIVGTLMAVCGLVVLSWSDFTVSPEHFWGDMLCLGSMLLFCWYLVTARRNNRAPSIWLYVVPVYTVAGVFCFLCALLLADPIKSYPPREIALILALAFFPTVIGHSVFNRSMQHLRGQVVSIVNMMQFIFAGTLAFVLLDEVPSRVFYVAAALVVCGGWTCVFGHARIQRKGA